MTRPNVIPFAPLSGRALVEQAREARTVPPRPRAALPKGHLGNLSRSDRLRAVAGVAQAMLTEAEQVLALIVAGRTADGPLSAEDVKQLAEFGLGLINTDAITAMVDDMESLHGR